MPQSVAGATGEVSKPVDLTNLANGGIGHRTDSEREVILRQLERILASPSFWSSKRYSALLKYLVDRTLQGRSDELKERTIGVAVFERPPDYDTSADHVVRSAGSELRKRLALYYVERGSEDETRIELRPGSYVPQFRLPDKVSPEAGAVDSPPEQPEERTKAVPGRSWQWLALLSTFVAGVLLVSGVFLLSSWHAETALDRFWSPVVAESNTVLLCIGMTRSNSTGVQQTPEGGAAVGGQPSAATTTPRGPLDQPVAVGDAMTLARLAGVLQARGKGFQILSEPSTTFENLRQNPVVLIGAFNNEWSIRLVGRLRFRFETPVQGGGRFIRDTQSPSRSVWSLISSLQAGVSKDYAIVVRCLNPETGKFVIAAAGLRAPGTMAAGEFLTSPEHMKKLAAQAPRGWEHKNLEVVLSTDVVKGVAGPPSIVASHFW